MYPSFINFLSVNNSFLSYLFIHLFASFLLCPQLVMKTKYTDTSIKLLLTYLLIYAKELAPLVEGDVVWIKPFITGTQTQD